MSVNRVNLALLGTCRVSTLKRKRKLQNQNQLTKTNFKWHVPNKPLARTQDRKHLVSNWPTRQPVRPPMSPTRESRSHIDSDQALSPSEKSGSSRRVLNSSFASCPSNASSERSPPNTNQTSVSSHKPYSPSKKPAKHTWWDYSRTPICAQSMPSV